MLFKTSTPSSQVLHKSVFGKRAYLFLIVTLCLENLSSGEKRAGWADLVGLPVVVVFYLYRSETNIQSVKCANVVEVVEADLEGVYSGW